MNFVFLAHADCEKDLGMTIPQIMKVKGSCSYVMVGLGWRSLGPDGIDMLRRASVYNIGNPALIAGKQQVAGSLLELLVSTVPTSVSAFCDAVSAKKRGNTGTDPLDVLVKVLASLVPADRKRFTVLTDRAFVCPHCGRVRRGQGIF